MADPKSVLKELSALIRRVAGLNEAVGRPPQRVNKHRMDLQLVRNDGTVKGQGWLGELPMTGAYEGSIMSEYTTGAPYAHKSAIDPKPSEPLIPLFTPNQEPGAISWMLAGGNPTQKIYDKAREFAKSQADKGQSPFSPKPINEQGPFPKPNPKYPEFKMHPIIYGNEGPYLPGSEDAKLRNEAGLASDDIGQLGAVYEAYKQLNFKQRNRK